MVVADRVALNVNIPPYVTVDPESPRARLQAQGDPNRNRKERLDAIKEEFQRALAYDRVRADAQMRGALLPSPDPRLSALAPYAKGEKPVIFRADRRIEILDALKLVEELKLKAIITGGLEAWKVADALKAARVPVLVSGTLRLPVERTDPYDAVYANPAKLQQAGVTFAIRSIGQGPDQATSGRNLPFEAAVAVAFGLPESEALKAVTLAPAQILGLGDQLGSLEVGKRANLVLSAGSILQPTTEVKAVFLGGRPMTLESRHTRLYAKYQKRLAEVRAGTAPLGLERSDTAAARPAPSPSGVSSTPVPSDRK
jgi:imidazolonepropionase-like amidohydrolase